MPVHAPACGACRLPDIWLIHSPHLHTGGLPQYQGSPGPLGFGTACSPSTTVKKNGMKKACVHHVAGVLLSCLR